jgi:hypothetical protein
VQTSADEWSQQAFECNPMTKRPVLKKYVQSFHIIQTKSFFFGVQLWAWDKAITNRKKKAQCHM